MLSVDLNKESRRTEAWDLVFTFCTTLFSVFHLLDFFHRLRTLSLLLSTDLSSLLFHHHFLLLLAKHTHRDAHTESCTYPSILILYYWLGFSLFTFFISLYYFPLELSKMPPILSLSLCTLVLVSWVPSISLIGLDAPFRKGPCLLLPLDVSSTPLTWGGHLRRDWPTHHLMILQVSEFSLKYLFKVLF